MVGRGVSVGIIAGAIVAVAIAVAVFMQNQQEQLPSGLTDLPQESVTLTAVLAEPKGRWDMLLDNSIQELRERHPDKEIEIDYRVLPYAETRRQILTAMAGQTELDLISVDVIWLGEFAEGGYLTDLTDRASEWGRSSDWYEENWNGGIYNENVYGVWSWTDVRALWYWKDMLVEAEVDADSLRTWDGYIQASDRLEDSLEGEGIQPVHLVGANHSPDMWYPYLWMLGGQILEEREGHPSRGTYWYPVYDSDEGVRALSFLKEQVESGIKPQVNHFWGQEFADRKFAVMLEGSWLLGNFPRAQWPDLQERVGMTPMFPVPDAGMESSTMMGGWVLSIPETSENKELAWELLTLMVDPEIISPMLLEYGYLPTQRPIAEGPFSTQLRLTIPYYDELVYMIAIGHSRPSTPEYPQIADHIRQAIDEVYYEGKDPKEALDDAARRSADVLGW